MIESDFDGPFKRAQGAWPLNEAAPDCECISQYDQSHFLTYARLIDAERAGTDWREAASEILLCDVEQDPERSHRCWQSHLARAHWVVKGSA